MLDYGAQTTAKAGGDHSIYLAQTRHWDIAATLNVEAR